MISLPTLAEEEGNLVQDQPMNTRETLMIYLEMLAVAFLISLNRFLAAVAVDLAEELNSKKRLLMLKPT